MSFRLSSNRTTLAAAGAAVFFLIQNGAIAQTNSVATGSATNVPPPMPALRSPMDSFRKLLVMPADERTKYLSICPPEVRERISSKLQEYAALKPEEAELRLLATELHFYLVRLMGETRTNRETQLQAVPERLRELVKSRLMQWDLLPPPLREELLETGQAFPYFSNIEFTNRPPHPDAERRRLMTERFSKFLSLTPREREDALRTLSEPEQREMEKTLEAFNALTPEQRDRCIRAFERFTGMSASEREHFLRNAERWSQMPPNQRQIWRELVNRVPSLPPLPSGLVRQPPWPPPPPESVGSSNGN